MICERCGCKLEENDTYSVIFSASIGQASYMACKKCSDELYQDLLRIFNKELVERCISIRKVEVLSDDLK